MSTALLVIDVQVGIVDYVAHAEELLTTISDLLGRARASNTPVLYVQHDEPGGGPLMPETPTWRIHPAIEPQPGEPVIRKLACDSFHQTTLDEELKRLGIQHLIVAGCQTDFCIDSTCRRAVTIGYDVTLVKEGHSTEDSKVLKADEIIAHHNYLLNGFGTPDHSVRVRSAREIVL